MSETVNTSFRNAFLRLRQESPGAFRFTIRRAPAFTVPRGDTVGSIDLTGKEPLRAEYKRSVWEVTHRDSFVLSGEGRLSHGWVEIGKGDEVIGEGMETFDLEVPPANLSFARVPLLMALFNALVVHQKTDTVEIRDGKGNFAGAGTTLALAVLKELADIADAQEEIAGSRVVNMQRMMSGT